MNLNNIKPFPVVCRQSSIGYAKACQRKWWYKYRMGIVLRGEQIKEAADLGKIYHRLQQFGPGSEQQVKAEIQRQQTKLMGRVNRGEDIDGQIQRKAGMLTGLYNKAVVMAQIFWEKFPQPSYFKTIGTEIKHSMVFNGLTIEGTIDKLIYNEQDDSVWIRDHKSTGRNLAALFDGMAWSLQARIYRILAFDYIIHRLNNDAAAFHFPENPKGFILDGILKPGIKLCKTDQKNAKDWNVPIEEAYLRRVKEWYENYEEAAAAKEKRNDKALDSRGIFYTEKIFPDELELAFDLMWELKKQNPIYPRHFTRDITRRECFAYEKQCIYHDLCTTDPQQWDRLFETKYKFDERENDEEVDSDTDIDSNE